MSAPTFEAVDNATQDLLSLIADDPRVDHEYQTFLDACQAAARGRDRYVYVNDVRRELTDRNGDLTIRPQRLSAFWNKATGAGRPMRKVIGMWETCEGSGSGNDGRPQYVRRWVG